MGKSNLLIAQGGGPTAVINCSLIGAIEESKKSNNINKIIGALHSIDGLVKEELIRSRLGKSFKSKTDISGSRSSIRFMP